MPAASKSLTILEPLRLGNARMVIGLAGWMAGGEMSTATIRCLETEMGDLKQWLEGQGFRLG